MLEIRFRTNSNNGLHLRLWYMKTMKKNSTQTFKSPMTNFHRTRELHQHPGPDRQSVSRGRRGKPNSMKISEGSKIIRSRKHEKYQSPTTSKTNFM